MLRVIAIVFAVLFGPAVDAGEPAPAGAGADLWDRTRDSALRAWQGTVEALGNAEGGAFTRVWEAILPKLNEVLALEERHEALPESAWFGQDQKANREAIEALLDESVAILTDAPTRDYRRRLAELEAAIGQARTEIAEYRQRRITAPTDSLWQSTADEYEQAIAERERRVQEYQIETKEVRRAFVAELRRLGLDLSEEQLEFMLATVVGGDLVRMGTVFDNVKRITAELEGLMLESQEDLTAARRYYGMYTVLLKALDHMHRQLMESVDTQYIPRIDAIASRTRALVKETRALQRTAPDRREVLAANLEAQRFTLRAAERYRNYLKDQRASVEAARNRLRRDIAVAVNTYETVKVSGELVGLVKSSRRLLDGLLELQVPPLRTFENREMKREFEKLTTRLQVAASP